MRLLKSAADRCSAYRLRYRVFVEELKWAGGGHGIEIDRYDAQAISIGLFDAHKFLISYLRIILPENAFMIEDVFLAMVDPCHRIRKGKDTVEITRLCVAPEKRGDIASLMLLFKGLYQWCLNNSVCFLYIVVEVSVYRMLRARSIPCKTIGPAIIMPDGVCAVACLIDIREFEEINRQKRPELMKWFESYNAPDCVYTEGYP